MKVAIKNNSEYEYLFAKCSWYHVITETRYCYKLKNDLGIINYYNKEDFVEMGF